MCSPQVFGTSYDFDVIYISIVNNIDYFLYISNRYWYGEKFVSSLNELLSHLQWCENNLKDLYDQANRFDFANVHGNGFRSFGLIFERCFSECYVFCKRLSTVRESIFFQAKKYLKETQSFVSVLNGLRSVLKFLNKMLLNDVENHLLMPDKTFTAEELIFECGDISQIGFYGRHQGFYYCTSMRRILQGVGVIVATFSDLYQNTGGPISRAASTISNGLKYIFNPELRAKQIVDVAQNSSVEFLKAFWSLSETQFMKRLPNWMCPKLEVREQICIPPIPVTLETFHSNEFVAVPAPSSHISTAPVRCMLLSNIHREGQLTKSKKSSSTKSKSLLFHCHGGGFVSQNPESHEIYLRHWAHDLAVPIISVDYSLAPEAPFPRALEEVLFAYAWVLSNPDKLGWTGEIICFSGDSAGGNILLGVILKAISLKIRLPDSVLCAYTPLVLDMVPSPSRLLCWIDPLLPLGFMISCLDAYAGAMETDGDEYADELKFRGHKLRKLSSINEIFDSSVSFLNECHWSDVEGNEGDEINRTYKSLSDVFQNMYSNNYVEDFQKFTKSVPEYSKETEERNYTEENTLYSFPIDIIFDVKTKCQNCAMLGLRKFSDAFASSFLYQNFFSPFVPYVESKTKAKIERHCDDFKSSILPKMKKLKILSQNPYMSPLLAQNDVLKCMPPIHFISLNFDPCLDDSITFAKRLKSLGKQVEVDIIDGLPHGFLNFLPFSQEAHDGSNLCVRRLKELMKIS